MIGSALRNLICCAALLATAPATAEVRGPASPQPAPVMPEPGLGAGHAERLTRQDLEAFLDGMLPSYMAIGDIAGAVVSVVKDDAVLLTKGYGHADVEQQLPVSAERTLFRPASISKLFTWTAVMQQVEAGRLDLDRDINEYLDFSIHGLGGAPITLHHLLTHTAGFEESLLDLQIHDPAKVLPLETFLEERLPERIYPPGAVPAYSNYGAALAGHIVARAAGMSFEDYVERHIFEPLGMRASTFRQPVPEALRDLVSKGYVEATGEVVPFEYGSDAPAGALSAPAPDIARFMLAHLNGGALPGGGESARILAPQTVELMHSVANRPGPGVHAMAHGFYEQSRNGVRVIAHGGDLIAFHSELVLIPSAKVGLYVSFNSLGKERATYKLRAALFEGFMDRYFPRSVPLPEQHSAAAQVPQDITGTYEISRRAATSLFSFIYTFGQQRATVSEEGVLEVGGLANLNDEPKRFREIEPGVWREIGGEMRVAVVRDAEGAVASLVPDGYGPIFILQPAPAWRNKSWLLPAIAVAGLIVVLAALGRLVRWVRGRLGRAGASLAGGAGAPGEALSRRLSTSALFSSLVFAASIATLLLMFGSGSFWVITAEARPFLRLVQLSALLAVLGAAAGSIAAVISWRARSGWRVPVGRSVLAAACLVWAYVALAFHFLAPSMRY